MGLYRVGAGLFIIDKNRDILLLKRSENTTYPLTWSLPGGSMESFDCLNSIFPKEKYENHEYFSCAVRETKEETNLDFLNEKFTTIHNIHSNSSKYTYKYRTFVVLVEDLQEIIPKIKLDLNENINFRVFSFEELKNIKRHQESDKNIKYEMKSIHPGLYDVIEEIEDEVDRYFKKLKQ